MRMRKKKHADERILKVSHLLISRPEDVQDRICQERGRFFGQMDTSGAADPHSFFPADRSAFPVCLEIGCGKGDFICRMASEHPEYNYIAMEMVADVACLAMEKAESQKETRPDNLRFLIGNARHLLGYFLPRSFDTIFLNFSDPWPQKGYAKRRLTHTLFLNLYRELLIPGGLLKFKTDNADLFEFSRQEFENNHLVIEFFTHDLHQSEKADENIETEYERNFSAKGFPIHSAWVRFS